MASARRPGTNETISTFGSAGFGRDYTDPGNWEIDTDINLVTGLLSHVLECYRDAASYDIQFQLDGAVANTTYFRIIRPGPGQGHDGTPNVGFRIASTTANDIVALYENAAAIYDIVVTGTLSSAADIATIITDGTQADGNRVVGCIVFNGVNSGVGNLWGIASSGGGDVIVDCLAHNQQGRGFYAPASTSTFYNCTSTNNSTWGFLFDNSPRIINCLATGNATADYDVGGVASGSTTNASGDATAPGTSPRINQTFTFADSANDDFHLSSSDAGARNFGTDLSADATYAFDDDIDGSLFSTWDIGFDEPQPAAPTSLVAKAGYFIKPTTGAPVTRVVSGVGFTPDVILFFNSNMTVIQSAGANSDFCVGVSDGTTERTAAIHGNFAEVSQTDTTRRISTAAISAINDTAANLFVGTVSSLNTDGFTVNFTTNNSSAVHIGYLAIASGQVGFDVSIGSFDSSASTGSQSVTGVGHSPNFLMLVTCGTATGSDISTGNDALLSYGFSDGTNDACLSTRAENGVSPSGDHVSRAIRDDAILALIDDASDAIVAQASVTSFDADGFTLNWSSASAHRVWYLSIAKIGAKVGTETTTTSTTTKSTVTGSTPQALLIGASDSTAIPELDTTFAPATLGASDGDGQAVASYFHHEQGVSTNESRRFAIEMLHIVNTSETVLDRGYLSSFDSDGFTMDYTTADASAYYFIWAALGNFVSGQDKMNLLKVWG